MNFTDFTDFPTEINSELDSIDSNSNVLDYSILYLDNSVLSEDQFYFPVDNIYELSTVVHRIDYSPLENVLIAKNSSNIQLYLSVIGNSINGSIETETTFYHYNSLYQNFILYKKYEKDLSIGSSIEFDCDTDVSNVGFFIDPEIQCYNTLIEEFFNIFAYKSSSTNSRTITKCESDCKLRVLVAMTPKAYDEFFLWIENYSLEPLKIKTQYKLIKQLINEYFNESFSDIEFHKVNLKLYVEKSNFYFADLSADRTIGRLWWSM